MIRETSTVRMLGADIMVDVEVVVGLEEDGGEGVEIESSGTAPTVVEAVVVAGDAGAGLPPAPEKCTLLAMRYQSPRARNNLICIDDVDVGHERHSLSLLVREVVVSGTNAPPIDGDWAVLLWHDGIGGCDIGCRGT